MMKFFIILLENFVQRRSFEIRPNKYRIHEERETPKLINSDLILQNIEDFMRQQMMIDKYSVIRGINLDYRPTSKYCHRAVVTILF